MIEHLDAAIGKILATLDETRCAEHTLVLFASDNGGTASARPTPFRGLKGTTFEGGVRVPCILRWPNHLPEKTISDQVALTMDLSASIVRIAGAKISADRPYDGLDILDRLEKNQPLLPRTVFCRARRGNETWWAVREKTYKYVARQGGHGKRSTSLPWTVIRGRRPTCSPNIQTMSPA
jgi:arylsulfatase A-like enzyme